jgi:PAS domain S-box-containing protein
MLTKLFTELSGPWHDGCFLLTREGAIVAANPAGAAILGLPPQEMAGRSFTECFHETAQIIADYLSTCIRNRQQMPGILSRLDVNSTICQYTCFGYRIQAQPEEPPLIFLRISQSKSASDKFTALNQQLERQQATHHQLLTSHTMLKTILDNLDALVYVADMESYEVLFVNKYVQKMLGKDITGAICWQTLQVGQTGPCPFCTNRYLITPDGNPAEVYTWDFQNTATGRWLHIQNRVITWANGRLVRLEIATDITERLAAEEKARRDKERAAALLTLARQPWSSREALADHALADAVQLTGSDVGSLHFMDEDQQTIELFTWSEKVKNECSTAKFIHYPLKDAGILADCIRLRQPVIHNDYPNTPDRKGYPDGHFPLLRHLNVPILDGDHVVAIIGVGNKNEPYNQEDANQLALYINTVWGILKQKVMELEILAIKEQWEKTFDAIDDIITIHDQDMRIIRANKAACKLFQMAPAALIGKHCYEVFRGGSEPCPGCPELLALQTLTSQRATICHANLGKTFAAAAFPVTDSTGATIFVHIAKDISELMKMEERLRQSQKMEAIGTLAGGIAHDFNNILAPILGYGELAQTRIPPQTPLASDLQQIITAALRAKDLVQQILAFSRQAPQERRPLRPHLVIKEALKLLRASLPTTIEICEEIATDCGTILADPTQLHQIVMNLCTNAYQAMRESGGILGVRLFKAAIEEKDSKVVSSEILPGNYVQLEVSDTGCGMDHATLERIFEPYFTTKAKGQGTGLGLSVVHGIVKGYQGQITVYSEPGKGTCFHVYLPLIAETSTVSESAPASPLPTGNERLLVVDDENMITTMLEAILANLGYQVTVVNNSEKALALIADSPTTFDLLITDMTMPHLTGLELTARVLAIRPELPIILCTGFSELINKEQARALGIRAYLMKPVSVHELALAVRKALDTKRELS